MLGRVRAGTDASGQSRAVSDTNAVGSGFVLFLSLFSVFILPCAIHYALANNVCSRDHVRSQIFESSNFGDGGALVPISDTNVNATVEGTSTIGVGGGDLAAGTDSWFL